MANRRDLHIGITGDSAGFDAACQAAEEKARSLDQELQKLERQQAAQEAVTARTAAAVKAYGAEQDKAALAAKRLGAEAQRAAQQAEQAQVRASAAADAYARGLINEEQAQRAAARAEDATERAAIKAAEAHRAAAKAADEQAQQERQLARDAELGAAAEELAILKASGRVQEHNMLLDTLQGKFGDLSKEGGDAFKAIEIGSTEASSGISEMIDGFSILGASGPVAVGAVAAAVAILPGLLAGAGDAISLGLGGALSLAAIKAQASASDVQAAFAQLKSNVAGDLQGISAPFHATLLEIAADANYAFKSLEPSLASAFALMGPAISRFVRYFADSLGGLDPAIRSIGTAFSNVLDNLGPEMPTIVGNIGTGIKAITDAVASNPQALANFVGALSQITRYVGDSIGFLIRYAETINNVFSVVTHIIPGLSGLSGLLIHTKDASDQGGAALAKYTTTLGALGDTSDSTTKQIAQDMQTLATATATAEAKATALADAFGHLLDPQAAVYSDTLKLRSSFDQLGQALAASGGHLDDTSAASIAAGTAFGTALKGAEDLATAMTKNGDSLDTVQHALWPYIGALAEAAGSNQQAQDLVTGFSRSLGLVAPALDTNGHAIGQFGDALQGLRAPVTGAQIDAQKLADDMDTLASKTATASDKANALSDAFTRLLDPALAAYQDTGKLAKGMGDLEAALKKSHGAMNDNNAAAGEAKLKFAALLGDAEHYAEDLLRGGDSIDVIRQKLAPYIADLYKAAGANKDARTLVDRFAETLKQVPSTKSTTLTSNADQQRQKVLAYQRQIDALHGKGVTISDNANSVRSRVAALQQSITNLHDKTVTIDYIEQVHRTLQAERADLLHPAKGGYIHRALGGAVQWYPDGGLAVGPGTGTSDSIPAMISNGEYVINAASTRQYRPLLDAINTGRPVPVAAAVTSGASGGSSPELAAAAGELRAAAANLRNAQVVMDGKPVGEIVSRHIGRQTDQRRRTG